MEVLIFCYPKKETRSQEHTDKLIQKSVVRYYEETKQPCPGVPVVLRKPSGKPFLANSELFAGVTHTDKWTFVGVSQDEFGIDAENIQREIRQKGRLLERFYSEGEQKTVLALPEPLQREQALRFWVQKEAMLKYCGVGISGLSDSDTQKASGYFSEFFFDHVVGYLYAKQPANCRLIESEM